MTNWFTSIIGGLAYYLAFGFLLIIWRVVSGLLGYKGAYIEDMVLFVALWMFCLPIFVLIHVSIEMVLELVGIADERTRLS